MSNAEIQKMISDQDDELSLSSEALASCSDVATAIAIVGEGGSIPPAASALLDAHPREWKVCSVPYDSAIQVIDDFDIVVYCGRVIDAMDDLELIRSLHSRHPLLPILLLTNIDTQEFKIAAYRSGAVDVVCSASQAEIEMKIVGLARLAKNSRLVEVQNKELILSINSLSVAHQKLTVEMAKTEKAVAERGAAQAKLVHSEKMASLGEMAGGIAHEINNSLGVLLGRVDQLRDLLDGSDDVSKTDCMPMVDSIASVSDRIAKIVRGLRAFSRNGEKDPFIETDINHVVSNTLSLCIEKFRSEGVDVVFEGCINCFAECREVQISQVVLNLLQNAFDAVRDAEAPWIKIITGADDQFVSISVADSGHGIPDEIKRKIMEPFFTTKEVGKGTGLGLSISKGIIDEHGGYLTLQEAKNTTFVINIPKKQ